MNELDDVMSEHTRKKVHDKLSRADDDLVLLGEIDPDFTLVDEMPSVIIETMNGDSEKFRFYSSRSMWRPFIYSDASGSKWLAVLRLHGRCLSRYIQADGYCPDCHAKHAPPVVESKSIVYKKRTLEENIAWWKAHNPYMLDKAPNYQQHEEITPGRFGDLADYSELHEGE